MTKLREILETERDLTLAGGKNGLDNIIELTHMAETMEICRDFVRKNELVFTTGSGLKDENELFNFVKTAYKNSACGVVINFGPYFPNVSKDIIKFADDNAFPVFTCTWEVRMPDIMYRICCLIEGEKTTVGKKSLAFKTAALYPERADILKRAGCAENTKLRIAVLHGGHTSDCSDASFGTDGFTFNIFIGRSKKDIAESLKGQTAFVSAECNINSYSKCFDITENFARVFIDKTDVNFIEDSGIYYLLLSLNDKTLLNFYADSIIGKIDKIDKNNKNELVKTLRTYLDNKKSLSAAAEILSVHKNTVNNKIKKIESALNIDISDPNDELNVRCAFIARDISEKI